MKIQAIFPAPPTPATAPPERAATTPADITAADRARAIGLPVHPAAMQLSNATPGGELAIVRVSDAPPALLAYLAHVGLAAQTRLTVQKHRPNSAVTTIQIRGHHDAIHLGSVACDALWVESTAA